MNSGEMGHRRIDRQRAPLLFPAAVVAIAFLVACSVFGSGSRSAPEDIVILTRLPTLTPTTDPNSISGAAAGEAPEPAAEAGAAVPTSDPANPQEDVPPTPTKKPSIVTDMTMTTERGPLLPEGWTINGVQTFSDPDKERLLLYGDLSNDSDTAREIALIIGTFYDATGQKIPLKSVTNFLPIKVMPPRGQLPFIVTVPGLHAAASYDLRVSTRPTDDNPHQDFNFSNLEQSNQASNYCLAGQIEKPGVDLESYLVIALILFDSQDQVINFSKYDAFRGGAAQDTFEICAKPQGQQVARHELRAWGE